MSALPRPDDDPAAPTPLHDHAFESLRVIREAMERAGSFTAVPGVATMAVGATAIVAALLAHRAGTGPGWLLAWIGEGILAAAISVAAIARKARRLGLPLDSGPSRKFALAFAPGLVAGATMTWALASQGLGALLPGTWLLIYGTAVTAAGATSVRIVPLMGSSFMALGIAALACAPGYGDWFMAAGFGGLHLAFGAAIARRHGG
ncbi:MAG TPA: hypothetical protein VFB67_07925 [Candidatus Polarisedimenticolaceae bacterium]|nr:hypothetical protein [Candidatus Polarisedimenticolaceae bacterium]